MPEAVAVLDPAPLLDRLRCSLRPLAWRGADALRDPALALARLRLSNGSQLLLAEPTGVLEWLRSESTPRWVRIVLQQQDSLEFSYSKPEALRPTGALPLVACPAQHAPRFRVQL